MDHKSLNPKTKHYEFLGPPGALAISLLVPITTYALYFGCSEQTGGCPPPVSATFKDDILRALQNPDWWKSLWDTQATLYYLAWYAFTVVAWFVLPGDWVEGVTMRNGEKKLYKINGAFFSSSPSLRILRPLNSVLHFFARAWFDHRIHLTIWPPILYLHLRQMAGLCYCIRPHVCLSSVSRLRDVFSARKTACPRGEQRKLHL